MKLVNLFMSVLAAGTLMVSCSGDSAGLSGKWNVETLDGKAVTDCEKTPYLLFDEEESRVNGCLGVNLAMGSYTLEGDKLTFSQMATTMMAGNPHDSEIESSLGKALGETAAMKIKKDVLSLLDKDGKVLVTLKKSDEAESEE